MNKNNSIRSVSYRISKVFGILSVILSLTTISCDNPLLETIKTIQAETISPRFILLDSDLNLIDVNDSIVMPDTVLNGTSSLFLKISNSGNSDLVIDPTLIEIVPGSDTEVDTFFINTALSGRIAAGESITFELRYMPLTLGTKTAKVVIPSNDVGKPRFTFSVLGAIKPGISFNKNDDVAAGSMPLVEVAVGNTITLPVNAYTKTGYSFAGWATSSGGGVSYNDGVSFTMSNSSITLYAKWTANTYKVSFNKNADDASGEMADQSITFDTPANLTDNQFITRASYEFAGWATIENGPVVYLNKALYAISTEDVTLYAIWKGEITFYGNGSTGGAMAALPADCHSTVTLPDNAFARTGYGFLGWADSPGGEVSVSNAASYAMGNIHQDLYAVWGQLYEIGDLGPSGVGTVFYITVGGLHGFEAAPSNWNGTDDPMAPWIIGGSTQTTFNGNTATVIGTGFANTNAIINQSGHTNSGASVCRAYTGGEKADWFLPSKDELYQMYVQRLSLELDGVYWSSSESDANNAWAITMFTGSASNLWWKGAAPGQSGGAPYDYRVRPIRTF